MLLDVITFFHMPIPSPLSFVVSGTAIAAGYSRCRALVYSKPDQTNCRKLLNILSHKPLGFVMYTNQTEKTRDTNH